MTPEPTYNDLPEASHEAVHAARDHAQKVEMAREVQTTRVAKAAADEVSQNIGEIVRGSLEHVLARGTETERAIILARVPYICQDIKGINKSLDEIKKMIERNRNDREHNDREREKENDKKYVNQDQFWPFKWVLITTGTVVLTTLAGALLAQILIKN